jgi:hypothetical protein
MSDLPRRTIAIDMSAGAEKTRSLGALNEKTTFL